VLGLIDVGRPQVADQQLIAAEDIKRQEAVAIIIAVEEAPLLAAVNRVVGGIEVEHQLLRRRIEGSDEGLGHGDMRRPGPGAVRRPLETAHRRGAGQARGAPASRLQRQIVAQALVVVHVVIAQRNREDTLTQQSQKPMIHLARLAPVVQAAREIAQQVETTVRRRQEQRAAVRGDVAAREVRLNQTPARAWKSDRRKGTIRHRRILAFDLV
jgi:hypothetical protein